MYTLAVYIYIFQTPGTIDKHKLHIQCTTLFNFHVHNQRCQMAVVKATFQNYGSFKGWMAVDNQ
jgi:hypothetical protein